MDIEEIKVLKEISKEKKEKSKSKYIASFPNLIDLVENETGELEFLIFDPTCKKCECRTVVEIDNQVYQPPPKNRLPTELLFPRKEKVLHFIFTRENSNISNSINGDNRVTNGDDMRIYRDGDELLFRRITEYLKERAELPDDRLYDVLTCWVFHTYAIEKSDFSPILYFLGLPEKGKSRMLKSIVYIARRGLRKIGMTDAQILRDCTNLDATLAMDMMDLWKKVQLAGSEDVFLNRPERGVTVSRVNRPEKGAFEDTDYYHVFGPTIFATNELIHEILETRAIPIIMRKSKKEFSLRIKPEDGMELKEMLTAWRACNYANEFPIVPRIAQSRLGDITFPLYQILKVVIPEKDQDFKDIIKEIEDKRIQEKADSLSGQIIRALIKCRELVDHGTLKGQIIANEFNRDKSDKEKFSSRRILNKLKTMGFETRTVHGGNTAIDWNTKLIESLQFEFRIENGDESGTSPETSPSPTSPPIVTNEEEALRIWNET